TIAFRGSVMDSDGIDHFRIVDGDRLMWASPETTWDARPKRFAGAIQRRIGTVFPKLGKVPIEDVFGGAVGVTVHGMPQIGQLRKGLWVASGFGRQGLNTSAMAGLLVARSILWGDERWRLFSPFELVWAGGPTGRVAGHFIGMWTRGSSAAAGALARYRERARAKERIREAGLFGLAAFRWLRAEPAQAAEKFEIEKTDAEWRAQLTPQQYDILRQHGTERPGSSPLLKEHRKGVFACAGCDLPLFSSDTKFESGTGWPSFYQPLENALGKTEDRTFGMARTEVHCRRCGGHLGHVFDDGPKPTAPRYCIDGFGLVFHPAGPQAS